jgi:tetrahydromethanopterin S-methyltransferase subunit G
MAPEQEKKYLEQQLDWISKDMESIKKRLDELEEEK